MTHTLRTLLALAFLSPLLAGCSDWPSELGEAPPAEDGYPRLLTAGELGELGEAEDDAEGEAEEAALDERAAILQARAARLRRRSLD